MLEQLPDNLPGLRDEIDQLDSKIQQLINQRALCAEKVGEVKMKAGEDPLFYRPEREAQVLRRVMERNDGPVGNEQMARLFREVMSVCLALEEPMKIAFLGPEGTFTQQASLKHFGNSIISKPLPAIDEVFREVEAGGANYGVVPVENSTEGVVNHTLDTFVKSPLKICGEVELRIHHHFMVPESLKNQIGTIKRIYSHQQSLAQCREWLDRRFPGVERHAVGSNAEAAKIASERDDAAAIGGEMAATQYGLAIHASNIEDEPDNTTRFLIIGRETVLSSGKDKTSLLISAENRPGALFGMLEAFARKGLDLSRIESRPSRQGNWNYVFFLDVLAHNDDPAMQAVLEEFATKPMLVKVLGSYPIAVL
ncbi:prephenate dehydratase [Pelagibaculum spongiae]|uniref:Bifunctional chorismate mutase/prephenate dehydratase n=2 Tax=Pelagibaculum spongiae TaxID=2080658 RepID=A0A2V1H5S7_9GAMM|nr:prephenate dehydratase [Pelagibaculum spongiae]PVZ72567.1 prephenate dehydratase [Pelagibaculum spongiae]